MSRQAAAAALAVAALAAAVLFPIGGHGFVAFDDGLYVYANPAVREGWSARGLAWAFSSVGYASNWHPLTWISHMLDVELFGLAPGPQHLVSLLLHAANAVLLLLLWRALTGRLAAGFALAALFAVHPLHVESVAWLAERKDVLSGFFFLLTLAAYLRTRRKAATLLLPAAAYALGLLAKPMLVTLPLVLLLLDYWPLGRFRGGALPPAAPTAADPPWRRPAALVLEKTPLLLLAALSSVMTILAQSRGGGLAAAADYPLPSRALNAAASLAGYLGKTFWPADLAFFYPHPGTLPPAHLLALGGGAIVIVTAVAVLSARSRPHLLVGWGWFLVMLLPVSGLVQVGDQAMADRYTYLPHIGVFAALVTEISLLARRFRGGRLAAGAAGAVIVSACAAVAHAQVAHWKDSESLYRHAAAVTTANWIAEIGLGVIAAQDGRAAEARERYERALRWRPDSYLAHGNLGVELGKAGNFAEAEGHLRAAVRLRPGYVPALFGLGQTLLHTGRAAEAVTFYRQAVAVDPTNPDALGGLGTALLLSGEPREARERLSEALRLRPGDALFRRNLDMAARAPGARP